MQVLKYNQYYLTLMGLSSNRLKEETNEFWHFFSNYALTFGLVGIMFSCSAIYMYQYMYQMTLALRAILLVFGSLQCAGSYINMGQKMQQTKQLQLKMQEFIDEDVEKSEMNLYMDVEERCRNFTKAVSFGYLLMAAGLFSAAQIFSFYCMWWGDFNTSNWLLPYNIYTPFDTSTIIGWNCLWLIQCYIGLIYSLCTTCFTTYFVSCSWYIAAISEHFKTLLRHLDSEIEQSLTKEPNDPLSVLHTQLNFNKILDVHIVLYEISELLGEVCEGVIFWMLSCNIVFFASALYQLEHTIDNIDIMIMYDILCLAVSFLWPYSLCNGATLVSRAGFSTGESVWDSKWYNFPLALRRDVRFVIARSQHEIIFKGHHYIGCNLQRFIGMINSAGSFYLMFRHIEQR